MYQLRQQKPAGIVHELTLVTANVADFRGFDGLTVEDWSKVQSASSLAHRKATLGERRWPDVSA